MDLTVRRFRQIVAAINRRLFMRRREEISLISWQTRQLSTFIAAGYMTDGNNPALDMAQVLAFDEIEEAQLEESQQRIAGSGGSNVGRGTPMFDENGDIIPIFKEPQSATFERFMGSMANPSRWTGR